METELIMVLHFPVESQGIRAIEEKFVELQVAYREQPSDLLDEEIDWMDWANTHLITVTSKELVNVY